MKIKIKKNILNVTNQKNKKIINIINEQINPHKYDENILNININLEDFISDNEKSTPINFDLKDKIINFIDKEKEIEIISNNFDKKAYAIAIGINKLYNFDFQEYETKFILECPKFNRKIVKILTGQRFSLNSENNDIPQIINDIPQIIK